MRAVVRKLVSIPGNQLATLTIGRRASSFDLTAEGRIVEH